MSDDSLLGRIQDMVEAIGPMREIAKAAKEGTGCILSADQTQALNKAHEAMGILMNEAADIIERAGLV